MAKKKRKKQKIHLVKSRKARISSKKKKKALKPASLRQGGPAKRGRVKIKSKPLTFFRKKKVRGKRRTVKKKKIRAIKVSQKRKKRKPPVFDDTIQRTKIRIIGIGGGGGSIISEIVSRIKKADFVVANTDTRALRTARKVKRFQFGESLTHGLGTGMNTELGELAAQNEKEKIKELFKGQDLCIIIASLGGGTGSGATPVFAKISRKSGCLTYGIFTLPFEFEGEKKMEIAKESLEKIRANLNAFSVIPNERIFQIIDKNTPLKDALSAINKRLAKNLEGLIEMIYLPGLINIDFADLRTILSGRSRLTYLNAIEVEEPSREEVAKKVISSPLYPYTLKGAKGILYNIVGGKTLQLSEVSQISKIISDSINKNAKIIFGVNQSQKYRDKIKITLLATGCGTKNVLLKPARPNFTKKNLGGPASKTKPIRRKRKITKSKKRLPPHRGEARSTKLSGKPKPRPKLHPPKFSKKILAGKPKPASKKVKAKPKPLTTFRKKVVRSKKKPKVEIHIKKKVDLVSPRSSESQSEEKIRRSGLQLKKVIEEEEKELLEQEKVWETPAILRRKK